MIEKNLYIAILTLFFSTLGYASGGGSKAVEPDQKEAWAGPRPAFGSTVTSQSFPSNLDGGSDEEGEGTGAPLAAPARVTFDSNYGQHRIPRGLEIEAILESHPDFTFAYAAGTNGATNLPKLFRAHQMAGRAGINYFDLQGRNPLFYARYPTMVTDLIRYGVTANAQDSMGRTALMYYVIFQANALANVRTETELETGIVRLDTYHNMIRAILAPVAGNRSDQTADPNQADAAGNTALHFVNNVETARLLLDFGANPIVVNNLGQTPADMARDRGDAFMAHILAPTTLPVISETAEADDDGAWGGAGGAGGPESPGRLASNAAAAALLLGGLATSRIRVLNFRVAR